MGGSSVTEPGRFDLSGRVAIVTGAAGLLGREHALALLEVGAAVALLDCNEAALRGRAAELDAEGDVLGVVADITDGAAVDRALQEVLAWRGSVGVLVNNAARNPTVEGSAGAGLSRLERFPDEQWEDDLAVGLTGAYRCARTFGTWMAMNDGGVILNIASDLAVIAPDQRLYTQPSLAPERQPVKPVSYSVVKHGLVGLTRYLATYWAREGVRANALSPGGVEADQSRDFRERLSERVPLGRMARADEYRAAVQFLCSDASSYMTGQNVVVDGGRSVW
jgi:NAD(P)-dependent dehydrogenase (short-subunit alcohol dehydrogenase family)